MHSFTAIEWLKIGLAAVLIYGLFLLWQWATDKLRELDEEEKQDFFDHH